MDKNQPENCFLANFERIFGYALLRPMSYAPVFMPDEKSHEDI